MEIKSNKVFLIGEITSESVMDIIKSIEEINDNYESVNKELISKNFIVDEYPNIELYINSYGGNLAAGLTLYSYISNFNDDHNSIFINTIGVEKVMSAAFIVYLAGHERTCDTECTFMIHSGSKFFAGKIEEIKEDLEQAERLNNRMFDIIQDETGFTEEELKDIRIKKQDYYMDASDAFDKRITK